MVVKELGVDEKSFKNIVTNQDHSLSQMYATKNWKYGASLGVSGTPTAFVNGIMLNDVPATADDWHKLLSSLFAPKEVIADL